MGATKRKAPLRLAFRAREGVVMEGGCHEKAPLRLAFGARKGVVVEGVPKREKAPLRLVFGAREGVRSGVCKPTCKVKIFVRIKKKLREKSIPRAQTTLLASFGSF